jgi:hypothetical protein
MKNKNNQILEIDTFLLLLLQFIPETLKDRGNMRTYYRKLSTQSIQQKRKRKNTSKFDEI